MDFARSGALTFYLATLVAERPAVSSKHGTPRAASRPTRPIIKQPANDVCPEASAAADRQSYDKRSPHFGKELYLGPVFTVGRIGIKL